jgi:hypothetical protein
MTILFLHEAHFIKCPPLSSSSMDGLDGDLCSSPSSPIVPRYNSFSQHGQSTAITSSAFIGKAPNVEVTGVPALSARPVDCRVGGDGEMTNEERDEMASWVAAVIAEMYDTAVLVNDAGRAIVSVFDARQKASLTGITIPLPNPRSLVRELENL